jgi:phosphoribosylanthranilate isomerase
MMLIKICGITNLADAQMAVDAGADILGFNFYRPSSRYIEPLAAREIIKQLPQGMLTAGVFVNESLELVEQVANETRVSILQLHGDESPEYCRTFKLNLVVKVLAVGHDFVPERALEYQVNGIMLDAHDKGLRGGTGHTIDWSSARRTRELFPRLLLAGGLSPENIAQAIAEVIPFGVDACSALESAPGKKDPQRVRAFITAARAAWAALGGPPECVKP